MVVTRFELSGRHIVCTSMALNCSFTEFLISGGVFAGFISQYIGRRLTIMYVAIHFVLPINEIKVNGLFAFESSIFILLVGGTKSIT